MKKALEKAIREKYRELWENFSAEEDPEDIENELDVVKEFAGAFERSAESLAEGELITEEEKTELIETIWYLHDELNDMLIDVMREREAEEAERIA